MKKCKQCKSAIKSGNKGHKMDCSYQSYESLPPSLWTFESDSSSYSGCDTGGYSDGGPCA